MIDAVASYHTSPFSCGVARFSQELARRIGVPHVQWSLARTFSHPLLSVKFQELLQHQATGSSNLPACFDLFAHDVPQAGLPWADAMCRQATIVYAANPEIAEALRARYARPVFASYCPPTFHGQASRGFPLFTFGMSGRVSRRAHQRLCTVLESDLKQPWTMSVSCAIHEGHAYESSVTEHERLYREIYGDRLRMLGCLSDDALGRELREACFVPLFFDPAARANHTSLWLALSIGCVVITNLDAASPPELQHGVNVFDVAQAPDFLHADERRSVRGAAAKVADRYSWDALVPFLQPSPTHV